MDFTITDSALLVLLSAALTIILGLRLRLGGEVGALDAVEPDLKTSPETVTDPRRWTTTVASLVAVLVVVLVVVVLAIQPWESTALWKGPLLFLTMLIGIAAKWVWDGVTNRDAKGQINLDFHGLLTPMLVSPLVFSGISAIGTGTLSMSAFLLCFQNGFFWQTVFGEVMRARQQRAARQKNDSRAKSRADANASGEKKAGK